MSKKVGLIHTSKIKNFDYGIDHPMKPERISMTYDLLQGYNLLNKFDIVKAKECLE